MKTETQINTNRSAFIVLVPPKFEMEKTMQHKKIASHISRGEQQSSFKQGLEHQTKKEAPKSTKTHQVKHPKIEEPKVHSRSDLKKA